MIPGDEHAKAAQEVAKATGKGIDAYGYWEVFLILCVVMDFFLEGLENSEELESFLPVRQEYLIYH